MPGSGADVLAARPKELWDGSKDAMRLEVLGADGQGLLRLSIRSVRRYLPLDVLSNSLATVERGECR